MVGYSLLADRRSIDTMSTLNSLRQDAERRAAAQALSKTVVKIHDSHYDRALGSQEVLSAALEAAPPNLVNVVAVGSDGTYGLAPRIKIEHPQGSTVWLNRVTPSRAAEAVTHLTATGSDPVNYGAFWSGQRRTILSNTGDIDPENIDAYLLRGGYTGLENALALEPDGVIDKVIQADLRGRGGAYFPTGRKWQSARSVSAAARYVVANAEEGEPGIYKDRHLLEGDPHSLIEGLLITGYAIGATKGYIYINAEAGLSTHRIQRGLEQARAAGIVGQQVLGSSFNFDVQVRQGAGGYVCGEETTLLSTIEGQRRVPRLRPPFPTEAGLFAMPTVINNVETLCNVTFVLTNGPEAYQAIGDTTTGTKIISLSGAVSRPGLVEVPMGTSIHTIVYDIGGGARDGGDVAGVVAGGPSGGLLPAALLDEPIRPGLIHPSGATLGSGGVIVLDNSVPIADVVQELASYNAKESCGKCTPCREGTPRMVDILARMRGGSSAADAAELRELTQVVASASLCGLGQMAGGPILSALDLFPDEFLSGRRG